MTPDWITSFEQGLVSLSGLGLVNAITGTIAVSDVRAHTGKYSLRANPSATTGRITKNISGSPTAYVLRVWFCLEDLMAADNILVGINAVASAFRLYYESSDNTLQPAWLTVRGEKSAALAADTWHYVDIKIDVSANPWTADVQVNGTPIAQLTNALAADTLVSIYLGVQISGTEDVYFDDIVGTKDADAYPIGGGTVVAIRPSADGTHNAGTVIKDDDGNVIDGSHPAWSLMDDEPWTATDDYVQQDGVGAGNYAEVNFEDIGAFIVQGAMGYVAYHASTASANNGIALIRDGAGQETNIYSGDMSEAGLYYKSAIITAPVAGWSQSTVNNLKGRVGYSTDVDGIPYWDAMLIEVALGEADTGVTRPLTGVCG